MLQLKPVAYVKNNRTEVADDFWGGVVSEIILTDEFTEESLMGIQEYSHLEIIFYFDQVGDSKIQKNARHPRNNPEYPKVGIFSQRGKNRPNKLGLTTVRLLKKEGIALTVQGLDAVDGTPVLDIKPVMKEFMPKEEIIQPFWSIELMKDYWKK